MVGSPAHAGIGPGAGWYDKGDIVLHHAIGKRRFRRHRIVILDTVVNLAAFQVAFDGVRILAETTNQGVQGVIYLVFGGETRFAVHGEPQLGERQTQRSCRSSVVKASRR